jgi:hypothetical protein
MPTTRKGTPVMSIDSGNLSGTKPVGNREKSVSVSCSSESDHESDNEKSNENEDNVSKNEEESISDLDDVSLHDSNEEDEQDYTEKTPLLETRKRTPSMIDEYEDQVDEYAIASFIKEGIDYTYPMIRPMMMNLYNASSIYLFWIIVHYISARAYVYYCVPDEISGFIMSPFLVSAPHCKAIRWVVHTGGSNIDNMWIIIGSWLCSRLLTNVMQPTDQKLHNE